MRHSDMGVRKDGLLQRSRRFSMQVCLELVVLSCGLPANQTKSNRLQPQRRGGPILDTPAAGLAPGGVAADSLRFLAVGL